MTPGPFEIILILVVVLLLFGAKRIPEIARGLGSGIREFKDATNDIKHELTANPPPARQIPQPPAQPYAAPPAAPQPSQPAATEVAAPPAPVAPPPADGPAPPAHS